jgi:hypothetical protein
VIFAAATGTDAHFTAHIEIKWDHSGPAGHAFRPGIHQIMTVGAIKIHNLIFWEVNRDLVIVTPINGA